MILLAFLYLFDDYQKNKFGHLVENRKLKGELFSQCIYNFS